MIQTLVVPGTRTLDPTEMRDIDGGFIPLVIIGVAVLLSGCVSTGSNDKLHDAVQHQPRPQPDTTQTTP